MRLTARTPEETPPAPRKPRKKAKKARGRVRERAASETTATPRRRPAVARAAAHEPPSVLPQAAEAPLAPEPEEIAIELDAPELDPSDDDFGAIGVGARMVPTSFESEPAPPLRPLVPRAPSDVQAQIRALEARLDGLIQRAARPAEPDPEAAEGPASDAPAPEPEGKVASVPPLSDPGAQEYVEKQWGREALRSRFEEVDDFGFDPAIEQKLWPLLEFLYRRYFRIETEGIQHVPSEGRAVIVTNHSGTLPLDGPMLRTAIRLDHPSARDLRWLTEDFVFHLPFAGVLLNRIGAVRACRENAERLLEKDSLVAVFPEGVHGIKKLFRDRYRLQRFGRGGHIRLCLQMRAPLVPCAVIGAEETYPLLYRFEALPELFSLPYLPLTPTFPWLGPLGLVPAPTRWKLRFGEPISFDRYGREAADDDVLVGRLSEQVRGEIQKLLDSGLRTRKSVWFG